MDEIQPRLLTIGEAAKRIGVSVATLRTWADRGLIPFVKLPSGHRRFEEGELERAIDRMYKEGKAVA